ncbi:MAG: hypothetical protein HBSAPP03_16560 [Phycisphaerae bacterium]|nr:MAG: hypothetical protein HBSAPP03_16560 [Phycisphaerae bacterium]
MPHIGAAFIESADGQRASTGEFHPDPGVILFQVDDQFFLDGSDVMRLIGDAANPWVWTGHVVDCVGTPQEAALSPPPSVTK